MARKITIKVNLDPDLLAWVLAEAKRRHCSPSQVVRDLIVRALERASKDASAT